MIADLHAHSTASDGQHAPTEVIALAAARGVTLLSLTDHDSIDGLMEGETAARQAGLAWIPGVELSCEGEREIHLLGYGVDARDGAWHAFFAELQAQRRTRAMAILERLRELGVCLPQEAVLGAAAHSVSRTHIAQGLMDAGAVTSIKEAFARYLRTGGPAYVARPTLTVADAVARLRARGAVPVLAHPGLIPVHEEVLTRWIAAWHEAGLMGIEVHYPRHTPEQIRRFERLARGLGLLVTGGSDFHGAAVRPSQLGMHAARWRTQEEDVAALLAALPCRASAFTS